MKTGGSGGKAMLAFRFNIIRVFAVLPLSGDGEGIRSWVKGKMLIAYVFRQKKKPSKSFDLNGFCRYRRSDSNQWYEGIGIEVQTGFLHYMERKGIWFVRSLWDIVHDMPDVSGMKL